MSLVVILSSVEIIVRDNDSSIFRWWYCYYPIGTHILYHSLFVLLSSSSGMDLLGEVIPEVGSSLPWHVSSLVGFSSSLVGTDKGIWLELQLSSSWPWQLRWFTSYQFLRGKYSCTYVECRKILRSKTMILLRLYIQYARILPLKTTTINTSITAIIFYLHRAWLFVW